MTLLNRSKSSRTLLRLSTINEKSHTLHIDDLWHIDKSKKLEESDSVSHEANINGNSTVKS